MKHHRFLLMAVACVVAAVLWSSAGAAPEDAAVGDIRAVLAKAGASVRDRPSQLAPATATLAHATRVRIAEVRGPWIRITQLGPSTGPAATGWLRANQTVQPFALTQAGRGGAVAVRDTPTQTDISAAGRQFDDTTEQAYRATRADLQAQYPVVDAIEAATPDADAVRLFILEGRLGRQEGGE